MFCSKRGILICSLTLLINLGWWVPNNLAQHTPLMQDGKPVMICLRVISVDGKKGTWSINRVYQSESNMFVGEVNYHDGTILGSEPKSKQDMLNAKCIHTTAPNGLYRVLVNKHTFISSKTLPWLEIVTD